MTTTRILALALVVQLALALVSWWPSQPEAPRPLFDLERDAIEEIEIAARPTDGDGEAAVVLARAGEAVPETGAAGWVIRSAADYPARSERVAELLDAIEALHAGAPIATQAAAHPALAIDDESYGRRLTVRGGGATTTWLLAPAGRRSVYARQPGEAAVYRAAGASEWSFGAEPASYFDASYVSEDPEGFEALAVRNAHGALRFEKRDGAWTLTGLAEGEVADPDAIAAFARQVAQLRMSEPVGREVLPEHGLDDGVRVDWTIAAEDQSLSGGYSVGAEVDSDVYVKAFGQPFVVRVSASQLRALRDAKRDQFLRPGS